MKTSIKKASEKNELIKFKINFFAAIINIYAPYYYI